MEAQKIWHVFAELACIIVLYLPSTCSGVDRICLDLGSTVFMALRGKRLIIEAELQIPVNQSEGILVCSDPFPSNRQIYSCPVPGTTDQPRSLKLSLEMTGLTRSGEYKCCYNTCVVYWFLRVRDEGYSEPILWNPTELIVAIFTSLLLVFSVVGSVYVFRGNWKEHITDHGKGSNNQKQTKEDGTAKTEREESLNVVTDPSTSFYASLEHRPRSIYDVLDHSAAKGKPDKSKAKAKKKELQQTAQTAQNQHEGVFESVYENF
ncbi:uncharacterized protein si:ch211-243a20.4 isoform X2 [Cheilinus undulatus]|uniref:uncharacterized protein si:ch211-243a20.4 isoform X2 n=1 Tax=Cheilinus undulatus TaxID=241271 RepID=UPI001BD3C9E0|nr:uncharacterized protein si:ch211-243a20.4 isoform X2 [Cheilinus undulatus]